MFRELYKPRDLLFQYIFGEDREKQYKERDTLDQHGLERPVGRENIWGIGFGFKGYPPDNERRILDLYKDAAKRYLSGHKYDYRTWLREFFSQMGFKRCIKMYVNRKLPEREVQSRFLASNAMRTIGYADVPIDVVKLGNLRPASTSILQLKLPVAISNSNLKMGHEGTAGAVIQGPQGSTQDVMLSCAHVMVDPSNLNAKDIVHPPPRWPNLRTQVVARWMQYRLRPNSTNSIDAAIAELVNSSAQRSTFNGARDPRTNEFVCKNGAATGLTQGEITGYSVKATGLGFPGWGQADFDDVDVVTPRTWPIWQGTQQFAYFGDSGSVVEADPTGEAIGLIFYHSTIVSQTLICKATAIQSALGVSF